MKQLTTPSTLPNAKRNALVVAAGIQCNANDCTRKANRWSNLCGQCEVNYLQYLKPIFGKPTVDQCKKAQAVIKSHYDRELGNGVFDDWCSQLARRLSRPIEKLQPPLALKAYRTPKERFTPLLALRTRDRGLLTKQKVINLLAYCLVIDATITPIIPAPVRKDYMISLLGHRFMGRAVYSRTTLRYQSRREKTGVIRYGPDGPEELTRRIEEEVPTKEYFRIRRADMRYIGRQVWKAFEKMVLAGGRQGVDWEAMKDRLVVSLS